jgi:hypothetical protein
MQIGPRRALSIQQPWASLIVNGYKRIENRSWSTKFRGPFLIHAGKTVDKQALRDVLLGNHPVTGRSFVFDSMDFPTGGIIGAGRIVDCVNESLDPFFVGPFGFVLDDVRSLPFQPCRGLLGFFTPGSEWTPPDYLNGDAP